MKFKREMLQDIVYDDCAVAERIENDEIECPEVEQKEVKVMEWVVKE